MTPWWVLALVEGLPDTSAYAASLQGGPTFRGWGWDRHIAAALFDALQIQTTVIARVAGAKGVKPPKPLPRPGDKSSSGGTSIRHAMRAHATASAIKPKPNRRGVD